ncbi:NupC Nucleoside permease [Pyrenophora tritici-repentis]|uniref:H+ nucleoside cotransporter n=2 Tax=Pyrenophora tritici-repentis TaxID=45151 RepID=A0A2W1E249_9PLEO|nr:sodium/nucleoside cotransporter 1 /nucleoside cotransporter 1 [Pyrenophora tritici-repentis Pt-1C-BFP]KAA8612653.1 h+ nucleoside cotransporter [Pyrenophora tritici-repentis]EDU47489.1 sodium/nucleoside cotransporter 1 /nucleoside cotransporter 1 [Pyrenophora tritici-repentis Pt-1C-BFP]KAF7446809.1 h+ nucleoside cotransporter [Pyrenophora tritici-repentis]KAF7569084.1 NupC, Nucleoside permease [Pyrenophora tritici-repentis]KAI0588628.1 h+ nucleoside cotransporter [Pyrenophora tritici-repenti
MADLRDRHNASPMPGVARNDDPALDIAHEHQHSHVHHSAHAVHPDNIVYTTGTTAERPSKLLDNQVHHPHRHIDEKRDIEKAGGYDSEVEKATRSSSDPGVGETEKKSKWSTGSLYRRFRLPVHIFLGMLFTGWWIASVVVHRKDKNWVIPFLLWLAIMIRLITCHVPITLVTRPMHWVWANTGTRFANLIPEKLRIPAGAALTISVMIIGSFASAESEDNTRVNRAVSLFGLAVFIFGFWATSRNRSKIIWHTVIVGMLLQFIVALFVLRTGVGYDIFNFVSELARLLLGFAEDGVTFLTDKDVAAKTWFFISVIPAIIFFVSFVQLLYYWGILQWFIGKFAVFFFWSMRVSGAEAVVASASPFIGQGESAMLIRPFVAHLTMAEMHQVMCSGFATIAGSVLVAYIGMGLNPQALISSCVMSIPASLAFSKLRYPEEEETLTAGRVVVPDDDEHRASNALHAFANGAWLGLKIAGMIISTLLCIIALLNLVDALLTWWGHYINLDGEYDLTLELILGYLFYPVAFLLGVSREGKDLLLVGRLIGIKVITNEFVAFTALVDKDEKSPYHTLSPRSRVIATYALCGFGNIGSLGTQIGVLSQISPARSGDVSKLALSALVTGVFSTLSSASVAGLVVVDQAKFSSGS